MILSSAVKHGTWSLNIVMLVWKWIKHLIILILIIEVHTLSIVEIIKVIILISRRGEILSEGVVTIIPHVHWSPI